MERKVLQAARKKDIITHRGTKIQTMADFSLETTEMRRQWSTMCKC